MDLKSFEPTKQALTLFDEFKAFAFKGNVIDLAIGVIIGGAFGNIVKSLVDHVIMPLSACSCRGARATRGGFVCSLCVTDGTMPPYAISSLALHDL